MMTVFISLSDDRETDHSVNIVRICIENDISSDSKKRARVSGCKDVVPVFATLSETLQRAEPRV